MIALTGATGYLGSHVLPLLGGTVLTVGRAGALTADLVAAPVRWNDAAPDVLVHCAGIMTSDAHTLDRSQRMTENLLATLPATVRRIVLVSSAYVYAPATVPVTEDAAAAATDPYGRSKVLVEEAFRAFADRASMPLVILRPCAIFGPKDPHRKAVSIFVDGAREGRAPTLKGPVSFPRDYIHVDDAARAVAIATLGDATGIFNVCTGHSVSAVELADLIGDLVPALRVVIDTPRSEPLGYRFDPSRAERELPFRAKISLRDAVAAMLA